MLSKFFLKNLVIPHTLFRAGIRVRGVTPLHVNLMQAVFRGFQVRRQYHKILWSVGVLEKAILRWRFKRKGLRGLQINTAEEVAQRSQESDTEEGFFRDCRKQAEERVVKAVVRVQTLFRSKKAQQEYRRMKLAHDMAKVGDFSEISKKLSLSC
ncbi:hypothetical protein V6Z11_D02G071000 [Gossypium hirsutum]